MGCCGAATRVNSSAVNGRYVPSNIEEFDGPVKERQCRDVIFLILFAAVLSCVGFEMVKAIFISDPDRLLNGLDAYGNVCGKKNEPIPYANFSGQDMTQKPYLKSCGVAGYICLTPPECVAECPPGYNMTIRRCRPDYMINRQFKKLITVTEGFIQDAIFDINLCRSEIVILCIISFVLACTTLIILRYFADVIIWITVCVVGLGGIFGTILLWLLYYDRKKLSEKATGSSKEELEEAAGQYYVAAIIVSIITVLYLMIVICLRKQLQLVAALFKEAGKAINSMPMILLQPVWTFLFSGAVLVLWVKGMLHLITASEPYVISESSGFVRYPPPKRFYKAMMLYYSVACAWLFNFIACCQDVIIAGSISSWYFARDKSKLASPIFKSFMYLVCYHLGSVAFGSALLTLVKICRIILLRLERLMRNKPNEALFKCCSCCLWILQKFLIYLNRNAFIEIAIYGHSFCKAAQQAFQILTSNILRVAAINSIGDFVLLITKIAVTVATLFIGLEILRNKEDLNCPLVPVGVACIFAFLVSHCFVSVYEMAIDTLFFCFCEDCSRNDGKNRPYFMNRSLMIFVENSKKALSMGQFEAYPTKA